MARRAAQIIEPEMDPLDEVSREDAFATASDLSDVLENMRGYDAGSIKGILYRVPNGGGKFENIETLRPPFNMDVLIEDLRERFGGGDFQLRMMVDGKPGVRKIVNFSIAKEKTALVTHGTKDDNSSMVMMFQMMMKQSEDASRARAEDMRDRQAASERQMTMIVGLATAVIPAFLGGREKTSDLMQAVAAMRPPEKGGGVLETLTIMKEAKELFGGQGEKSDDLGDIVKGMGGMIGPGVKAVADLMRGRQQAPPQGAIADYGNATDAPPLTLGLPAPMAQETRVGGTGQYPVLDLIRADVLYFFTRQIDPEKAADVIYDILEANEVTEADINGLVVAISADPLEGLAAEGIDLRSRPEWGNEFLQFLISIHTDDNGEDDDRGRGDRGEADPSKDGANSAEGAAKPDD